MMDHLTVFSSTGPASHDLAFEAEMLEQAAEGRPTLLMASWPGPVVVLGYAQPPGDADIEWCRRKGIPILRRLSGGTGVVHRGDLSLSLVLPREHPWVGSVVGLYERFLDVVQPALAELGSAAVRVVKPEHATRVRSPICFFDQLADTLVIDGRKVVGCSQARKQTGVLIHAAVLLGLETGLYSRVFGVDDREVGAQLAPALHGTAWRRTAERIAVHFGRALELQPVWSERPAPAARFLEPYARQRWAPVRDDGIQYSEAEL